MKIVIADPQARVRHSLRILLEQQPGWTIEGEAADSQELLEWVRDRCPNLVLIDWDLPGLPGENLFSLLREQFPNIMRLAMSGRQELRQSALNAGADDFASKTESPDKLLATIRELQSRRSRGR
jgi:DNA-binding NarL/FixJ family response regulator